MAEIAEIDLIWTQKMAEIGSKFIKFIKFIEFIVFILFIKNKWIISVLYEFYLPYRSSFLNGL